MANLKQLICDELRRNLVEGDLPRLPAGSALYWKWFSDLSAARTYGPAGPLPLAFAEIDAYARLNRWPLRPDHVAVLIAMDKEFIEHAYRGAKARAEGVKVLPARSSHAVSAATFDAMFG